MNAIERRSGGNSVITANSSAATTAGSFPYDRWAAGLVYIAATNGATQIKWHASPAYGVTPLQVYDSGNAVVTNVTVGAHSVPDACFAAAYICPVITGATTMAMTVGVKG
jgi:hypothetical protein